MKVLFKIMIIFAGVATVCIALFLVAYLTPLLPGNDGVWEPTWSPNGQRIAFRCLYVSTTNINEYQMENYDFDYNKNRWGDVCVIGPNGDNFLRLTFTGKVSDPAWSSDGRFLAWLYGKNYHIDDWESIQIWDSSTKAFDNIQLPEKVDNGQLVWSADGKRIFIQGNGGAINLTDKSFTPITPLSSRGDVFSYYHSQDSNHVVYKEYLQFPEAFGQVVVTTDGKISYIYKHNSWGSEMYLSPSGKMVAYYDQIQTTNSSLFEEAKNVGVVKFIDLDTGILGEYINDEEYGGGTIVWSADGSRLVIVGPYSILILMVQRDAKDNSISIINVLNPDCLPIKDNRCVEIDGGVSWSPDGQKLILGMDNKLWITKTDGTNWYNLQIK